MGGLSKCTLILMLKRADMDETDGKKLNDNRQIELEWTKSLYDFLSEQIYRTARGLHRRPGCDRWDREDFENDLWLAVVQRFSRFDPSRGSVRAYFCTVIRNYAEDIARRENAQKRHFGRNISISEIGPLENDKVWLDDLVSDLNEAVNDLPEGLRDIAHALMQGQTVTGYARHRGFGRGKVRGQMDNLKRHLQDHGLDPSSE